MRSFGKLSLVAAAIMASTALAHGADMVPQIEQDYVPEVVPIASVGGWYIRGDIGYSTLKMDEVYFEPLPGVGFQDFSRQGLDDTWSLQGGIGYQVTDYFRVDATITHYFETDFSGRSSSGATFDCAFLSPDNGALDTDCSVSDASHLEATVMLANAYVDLGTINGFTPYVGAGIGGAKVRWGRLDNDTTCAGGTGDCLNGFGDNYNTFHDSIHSGARQTRFAWALHAGASSGSRPT